MGKTQYLSVSAIPDQIIYQLASEDSDLLVIYMMYIGKINISVLDKNEWPNKRTSSAINRLKEMWFIETNEKTLSV